MALAAFAGPVAGLPVLGWPAPAAGIVAVLAGLDRTGAPPGRTPLIHSPAAALLWGLAGCAAAMALAPGEIAGTALALSCGFCATLALDALADGELFLWPKAASPADWLSAYPPEGLVELGDEPFVVPCACGALPRPWAGWSLVGFRRSMEEPAKRPHLPGWMSRRGDLLLSAVSLLALLAAVTVK